MAEPGTEIVLRVNATPLARGLQQATRDIKRFETTTAHAFRRVETSSKRMSMGVVRSMRHMGQSFRSAGWALAPLAGGITLLGRNLIMAGSEAEQFESRFVRSFGNLAPRVRALSEAFAANTGLSAREFREQATQLYDFARAMGVSEVRAMKLSTRLTELATDLASRFDTPVERAFNAIMSGLAGQPRPLKFFAIDIADEALKDLAKELGSADIANNLRRVEKALLAEILMLRQSERARGDFKKTADELANQFRIFGGAVRDTSADVGDAFIPVTKDAIGVLAPLIKDMGKATAEFLRAHPTITRVVAAMAALTFVGSAALIVLGGLGIAIAGIGAGISTMKTALPVIAAIGLGFAKWAIYLAAAYVILHDIKALLTGGDLLGVRDVPVAKQTIMNTPTVQGLGGTANSLFGTPNTTGPVGSVNPAGMTPQQAQQMIELMFEQNQIMRSLGFDGGPGGMS